MENIECPYLSLLNSFWLFRAEGEIYFFSVCISVHPCPQLSIPFPRVGDLISSQSCQSCLNSFFYKPESIPYLLLLHVLHERPGFQEQLFSQASFFGWIPIPWALSRAIWCPAFRRSYNPLLHLFCPD